MDGLQLHQVTCFRIPRVISKWQPKKKGDLVSLTCPEQNDLVLQGEVREVGNTLGPFNKSKELLVSSMAYVGDRVICLKKEQSTLNGQVLGLKHIPSPSPAPSKKWEMDGDLRPPTEFSMFMSP